MQKLLTPSLAHVSFKVEREQVKYLLLGNLFFVTHDNLKDISQWTRVESILATISFHITMDSNVNGNPDKASFQILGG